MIAIAYAVSKSIINFIQIKNVDTGEKLISSCLTDLGYTDITSIYLKSIV